MDIDGKIFVLLIIAISTAGWIINNWIRARHAYELEDEWGGKTARADTQESSRLREENSELHAKLEAMQDRMIVLEKIVTDRGYSLSQEIEALRDPPTRNDAENGVRLNLNRKEQA